MYDQKKKNHNLEQIMKCMTCEYVKKNIVLTDRQHGFINNKVFEQATYKTRRMP